MFNINDLNSLNQQINEIRNKSQWKSKLEVDKNGKCLNTINNYTLYIKESPKYKNKFKYNDFLKLKEYNDKEFNDFNLNILYNDIERELGLSSHSKVDSALMEVFYRNKYNPIIDYLNNLVWDGKKRLETLFIDLLDVEDTRLNRYMTKMWFIAAVKRIFQPGCKFDNMIVLQGSQGIGKSTICDLLSLNYSCDISLNEIGNKDIIHKLNKSWIVVIDELDSFNKKEMSNIKSFISNTKDTARLAYAKNAETYSRHCVFIGTTNDSTFLRDNTSMVERRFWVIKCNKTSKDSKIIDTLTKDFINQIWSEVVYYYKQNPNMYLDISNDLLNDFANEMKQFKTYNEDVVIDYVNEILNKSYRVNNKGEFINDSDFYEQYTGSKTYNTNSGVKINKIPYSYVRYVLKKVYNEERTGTYIGNGISDEWEFKSIRYNGRTCKGYERKKKEEKDSLF